MKRFLPALLAYGLFWINVYYSSDLIASDTAISGSLANTEVSLPQGTSIHILDNGLEVLLIENPILPMIGVNVVVKIGSAYETFATSGMSHMLEHLLFNGTTSRTQKELYNAVDMIGGYNNANTSHFYTNFMMVVPSENIQEGMQIQADMLFNSILPEDKFEKEKGIVLEEIAQSRNKPLFQLDKNLYSVLFKGHALSLPTLGTYATIESLSRDDVHLYYKNSYVPNNMIMSVIGSFETGQILQVINDTYGKAQPFEVLMPHNPMWKTGFSTLPESTVRRSQFHHRFYEGKELKVQILYDLPLTWGEIHSELLQEAINSPLELIKNKMKTNFSEHYISLEMENFQSPLKNFLQFTVSLENNLRLNDVITAIDEEIKVLKLEPDTEITSYLATKARTDLLKNLEKPHMFGIYNANLLAVGGIEQVLSSSNPAGFTQAAAEIAAFQFSALPLVIIQHPASKGIETEGIESTEAKLFVDEKSGLTVIAKQNKKSDLLALHFLFKHKAYHESRTGRDLAKILHDCFGQHLTSLENQKISNRFGFTFKFNDNPYIPMDDIYLDPDFAYIRVEGLADNLKEAIAYICQQFVKFTPSKQQFDKAIAKFSRPVGMMGGSPAEETFKKIYKSLIYESPKYSVPEKDWTFENLLSFHQRYFSPPNMIVSVVSPVGQEDIYRQLQQALNKKKSDIGIEETAYQQSLILQKSRQDTIIKTGGEQSFIYWGFSREIEENDKPALQALSLLLSDRIVFDIREKQGRAYRMRAGIDMVGKRAIFYVRIATRPDNLDPLLEQIPGFFGVGTLSEVEDSTVGRLINMYLGRMQFRRLSSINQAYYLAHSLYFHNDMGYDAKFLSELKKIRKNDVKRVAEKYLQVENPVTVIVN